MPMAPIRATTSVTIAPALGNWLHASATGQPDVVALESADRCLSYRELAEAVGRQAAAYIGAGLTAGDRVGIAATRSADTIIAILAALDAGIAYLPLDLSYPAERLQAMLSDAAPRAVVGEAAALAALKGLVGDYPTLDRVAPHQQAPHAVAADLAYVLFTSGSTGRPKGVAMGAEPLRRLIEWHVAHPRLGRPARTLQFAPLSFDVHFQEILSTFATGGTLVLIPDRERRDPGLLRKVLAEHRVERLFLPYVALQMLAQADEDAVAGAAPPLFLADVVSAGEQLQITPDIRALFDRQPGAVLHNHYGPTETHVVTAFELSGPAGSWPDIPPIGDALPHVDFALRDPESGGLSAGRTGELLLGGQCLAHGYLGRSELTAERFLIAPAGLEGRWYATGDLVRRADGDGKGLTYLGRIDQQIKVDGFRIEPGEIELTLMAHEAIQDAAVTAPDVPESGRQLVAHVVLRSGGAAWSELLPRLRPWLRQRLPDYMIPARFIVLDKLPTTQSGKIDRRQLAVPATSAPANDADRLAAAGHDGLVGQIRQLWQELLGVDHLDDEANVFDWGARSLLVMRFVSRLKPLGIKLSVADIYDHPSVAGMAQQALGTPAAKRTRRAASSDPSGDTGIAIVGIALRADNARDIDTFWANLLAGREAVRRFAPHELDPSVPAELRTRPNFVAARGVLEDADRFDAAFFGISQREATVLDPQQRLFLELCWSALEDAAIDPGRGDDRIGVFGGTGNNTYLPAMRAENPELIQQYGDFATMLASEKDYVATRVANRLNLRGPAVSVHTACSTSLVAVAEACNSLTEDQCDVALAGGSTVVVPQAGGYLHVEGGMESADGRCRPFDAEASGTLFASGGGVVALKRLARALDDGDPIYGVIKGVGLNNDGGNKASFTAPSVAGQAEAIRMALDHAGVDARSIGYVEAHGTGTSLGDPIEVAALVRAWSIDTQDRQFCRLGSVKGHLGHMVAAAGVMGLIKATLSLHREVIPGTLHYQRPNPQIDFASTPFQVSAQASPWPRGEQARRAAVSGFGVGGTNAHVIVEEAPGSASVPVGAPVAADGTRQLHLWPLSARTAEAALQRAHDLADYLERHPDTPLDRVTNTLTRGRQPMPHRLAIVLHDLPGAVAALRQVKLATLVSPKPRLVFLFPGQGSQHPGMARQLADEAPAFRDAFDQCLAAAPADLAADLRAWLIDTDPRDERAAAKLAETRHAQPALFSVSYALAAWLDSLGIRPQAMIGHSIGEYAAACHAGVISPADAMRAVIERGRAMFDQPPGAMLAIRAGVEVVATLLPPGVEIAAANAPALTVASGPFEAIEAFAAMLETQEIGTTRLKVSHAFHSASMDGALPRVAQALARSALHPPSIPVYSGVSGEPLTPGEATDPAYWARQVRATVRFSRAVQAELSQGEASGSEAVFVEIGPGQALTALLRQHRSGKNAAPRVVPMLGTVQDPGDPARRALQGIAALWSAGVPVAWPIPANARRIPLPGYPFRGERYWFRRRPVTDGAGATTAPAVTPAAPLMVPISTPPAPTAEDTQAMSRLPRLEQELSRIINEVAGIPAETITRDATFIDQGLDSLSMTQATLELERIFGIKLRFRRLQEDLNTPGKLAEFLDAELPVERFAPEPASPTRIAPAVDLAPVAATGVAGSVPVEAGAVHQLIQQQMQLMAQQLAILSGTLVAPTKIATPPAPIDSTTASPRSSETVEPSRHALLEKPFGASARITLAATADFTPAQRQWLDAFVARYIARTGRSKAYSQSHRKVMADPRVVTGFNPLWKELVYPIVVDRSHGARLSDIDGNEYIDLLSCFGANLLGYRPQDVTQAMLDQIAAGIEVGPQHPLAAEVAELISEMTGMERVAFCSTGSEAVMGAMRIARTVTGRKTIAIFTNSYHGLFDEVIVRGTKQLRSLSAAPGILASAVENVLVLDYDSEESLRVLRERGRALAAIMIEPVQNKYPTLQPRAFVDSLRQIADRAGCALIFDEVVTGFRLAPGGAQEFYGVRADIATYGKVIGGGLPFAAIAGASHWMDALDGGHWEFGDDSYPEAGVTYFAGTFARHPLALAAAKATLLHLKRGGRELYRTLNDRTQGLADRLNAAFLARRAPVRAVHCASLWRLSWEGDQQALKYVSLFYYLLRFHGLHVYEQFGHFVTAAMGEAEIARIVDVFTRSLDELMARGFIGPRDGAPPPDGDATDSPPNEPASAPLAPGQRERWLAASYDDAARRALNESFCLCLSGDVNLPALRKAVLDVLERHQAFRIRFDLDEPRQELAAAGPLDVAETDLRHLPDAGAALDTFCSEASRRDFPLDRAPLAAVSLLRLADGRVVVHLVASHLIFDGWAASVFSAELAAAYRARNDGRPPMLPPAESPLRFARQQQVCADGPEGVESLHYWQRILDQPPPPLALGDLAPPTHRRYAADTVRSRFDGDLLSGLRAQAQQSGATLFQLLLAAVTVMLRRQSGQADFVIGIPCAGQSLCRLGPLLADGVLDLPLRLECGDGDTGAEVLQLVRSRLLDALEHPLATQGAIARALGMPGTGDRPAITGIFFNLNPKVDLSGFAPLVASMHEGRKQGALQDLFFNFYEHDAALTLDLHYSAEYFSPARAEALVDDLRAVCGNFAGSLRTPVGGAKSALDEVDARLKQWNSTDATLEPNARIERWVARQAAASPDAIAIESRGTTLTYEALESRANRYARLLRRRGIASGDLVGLCLSRGPELLPALLGVLKTGAAYVPLDPGFPRERLHYMASDAGVRLVITESAHADQSGVGRKRQIRIDDDAAEIAGSSSDSASDSASGPASDSTSGSASDSASDSAGSDDAPAYVIYTSGSTGQPKGVVVPQRAVCNFLASMRRQPGLLAHDRLLAVTTLSFDIAVLELLLPLTCGARVIIAEREDAMDGDALKDLIGRHGITVMQATPTTWHLLLDAGWQAPRGFKALCGGEALPPALSDRLLEQDVELWNMYGPTETTVWSTLTRITQVGQKITIGRPIDNTQVWTLDEQLKLCPIGGEGEICIGGAGVGIGYFHRPELTAERFIADPFSSTPGARLYRTGDLGRWRDDGVLEHLGRLDFQVKIRGFRIELGEIEARLAALAGVARCVVMAREDDPGDVVLVAYVVSAAGGVPNPRQLREALRADLPDYMVPRAVVVLDALPLLPNGKIDRKALPAPGHRAPADDAIQSAPPQPGSDDLAQTIARAMAAVLGIDHLDLHDNFFELGGHSLLAAKLSAQLAVSLGHRTGLRAIFEAPTPALLASALRANREPAKPDIAIRIPVRADQQTAPLSQLQKRIWFLEQLTPGTVVHNMPSGHRLTGPLNVEAFNRAFQMLVQRQSVLRTVIERTAEGDRQRVVGHLEVSLLPLTDYGRLPESERLAALERHVGAIVNEPFDLETGPLFAARLFRLSPEDHVFLFIVHHLIWDGWSFDLLYADLPELYAACLAERNDQLPPLTVSYGDFAAWHNEWMSGAELARQTRHWVGKLTPLPPAIDLPLDHPRPPVMSGRGDSYQFDLQKDVADALRAQLQRQGRTLYVALLGTYVLLLHRLTGQTDFVVGTPVRGREQPSLEPLMGFFVNMLPLRMRIDPQARFSDWLATIQNLVVESFSYPDVPFEHLVNELGIPRDTSRPAVHQVTFSYQDVRERQTQWGNVVHRRLPTPILGAAQDLGLWCVETRDHIEYLFTFNTDVLDASTVAVIAAGLESLLKQVVPNPDLPLAAYDVVTPARRDMRQRRAASGSTDVAPSAPSAAAPRSAAHAVGAPDAAAPISSASDPLVAGAGSTQPALPSPAPRSRDSAPCGDTETLLASIWADLLKTPDIRADDNFFDLGGHSLLAMQVIVAMEARTGKRLSPRHFIFETLRQTARAYDETHVAAARKGVLNRLFSGILGERT